jgi:cytochrome b561
LNNTNTNYGYVSIFFHWLSALCVFGLFALGYYMVDLTYYHEWYKTAPELHKSIGILFFFLMIFRIVWRFKQISPDHLPSHSLLEQKAGKIIHTLLYWLIFTIMITGYFISTADGRGIEVFELFVVPALGSIIENQEDVAGLIHKWLAYLLIALAILHALAALKHHFIDKDNTLNRIIGKRQQLENINEKTVN